jgi:hypothetical protein
LTKVSTRNSQLDSIGIPSSELAVALGARKGLLSGVWGNGQDRTWDRFSYVHGGHTRSFVALEMLKTSKEALAVLTLESLGLLWRRLHARVFIVQRLAVDVYTEAVFNHPLRGHGGRNRQ